MRRAKDLVASICLMFPLLLGIWTVALSPPRAHAEADTLGVISPGSPLHHTRVRLTVTTQELIRALTGPALTAEQLRRNQFIGTLQGRRDDDVVIRVRPSETELAIPIRSVSRLESSLGTQGRAGRGALIGLGAGMVGGVVAGLIVCSSGDCESSGFTGDGTALVATVLGTGGAIVGCGVGALTGALIRTERWRTVPIQDLPYGEGLPVENGIRIGLNLPIWSRDLVAGTEGY